MVSQASRRRDSTQVIKPVVYAPAGAEPGYRVATIRDARVGPRRELTLLMETWTKGKSTVRSGDGDLVTLRFGAVSNYAEVQSFFAKIPMDDEGSL